MKIIEAGGTKIGITSVLGDEYQKASQQSRDRAASRRPSRSSAVIDQLKDCDLRILLANATLKETEELAEEFPQFNIVVTADGGDEPPNRPAKIEGTDDRLDRSRDTRACSPSCSGFYDDPKQPMRYQRVALDSRFAVTPEMKQLMVSYQEQLQALGLGRLGAAAGAASPRPAGRQIVGPLRRREELQRMPPTAFKVWKNSKHAHATETLVKLDPPRQFDPECISCHATGWNPQEFFPYATGFVSLTRHAAPGRQHVRKLPRSGRRPRGGRAAAGRADARRATRALMAGVERQRCASSATTATTARCSISRRTGPRSSIRAVSTGFIRVTRSVAKHASGLAQTNQRVFGQGSRPEPLNSDAAHAQ